MRDKIKDTDELIKELKKNNKEFEQEVARRDKTIKWLTFWELLFIGLGVMMIIITLFIAE